MIAPSVDQENKEVYLSLKREGYTDKDIAGKMYIGTSTLTNWKKRWGIKIIKKPPNEYGVTEAEFAIAAENGISRSNVLTRIRMYDWPIDEAITRPVIKDMRERRYFKKGSPVCQSTQQRNE